MQKKLKLAVAALCCATSAAAQVAGQAGQKSDMESEQAFTFTEAQLGEDADMTDNVIIVSSNSNISAPSTRSTTRFSSTARP